MGAYLNGKGINISIDTDYNKAKQIIDRSIAEIFDGKVEAVGRYAFRYCEELTRAEFPQATTVGQYAFGGCVELVEAIIPKAATIENFTFSSCPKLVKVDCAAAEIKASGFSNSLVFDTLVLRDTENVCTLAAINAFNGTPFAAGNAGGTVYVPAALIAEYQAATNWVTLYEGGTCNFVAIEGSEYE